MWHVSAQCVLLRASELRFSVWEVRAGGNCETGVKGA